MQLPCFTFFSFHDKVSDEKSNVFAGRVWCQPQFVLGIAILCLQVEFGVNLSMF